MKYTKPGRPVTHPKVIDETTGVIFDTYTAAAESVGGSRYGVMRCCWNMQKHHKGHKFIFSGRNHERRK